MQPGFKASKLEFPVIAEANIGLASCTMVVAELLRWKSPAVLILAMVMLGQTPYVFPEPPVQNDFVEVFAGDAAVTLACWNRDCGEALTISVIAASWT